MTTVYCLETDSTLQDSHTDLKRKNKGSRELNVATIHREESQTGKNQTQKELQKDPLKCLGEYRLVHVCQETTQSQRKSHLKDWRKQSSKLTQDKEEFLFPPDKVEILIHGEVAYIMALQRCLSLIPRTWEYVMLHGERGFAAGIPLRVFRWRDHPGLSRWGQCNHQSPYKWEAGGSESEKER